MGAEKMLSKLRPPRGAVKKRKRIGRGPGSGTGKTSGKGHKGQRSRSGGGVPPGFEGGQMPLRRRLPKRGFTNIFRKEFAEVNVRDLERVFDAGATVDLDALKSNGLVPNRLKDGVKILGHGELTKKFTVHAHKFTDGAKRKIEAVGGAVEVIEGAK